MEYVDTVLFLILAFVSGATSYSCTTTRGYLTCHYGCCGSTRSTRYCCSSSSYRRSTVVYSSGTQAGIAIGVLAIVAIIIGLSYFCKRNQRYRRFIRPGYMGPAHMATGTTHVQVTTTSAMVQGGPPPQPQYRPPAYAMPYRPTPNQPPQVYKQPLSQPPNYVPYSATGPQHPGYPTQPPSYPGAPPTYDQVYPPGYNATGY